MRERKMLRAVTAMALFAGLALVPTQAAANHAATYTVQVGAQLEGVPAESMRFLPSSLTVHQGDTLTFMGGFHTATLLPANVGAQDWIDDNAKSFGQEWFPFVLNPDDSANPFKLNNQVLFPPPDCGSPSAPCVHDGSQETNSGLTLLHTDFSTNPPTPVGFNVTADVAPGDFFWVVCLIHPHMRMKVRVVADNEPASDPATVEADSAAKVAQDTDSAKALNARLLTKRTKHVTASGQTVWDAYVGYDTHNLSLFGMYPKTLKVAKGETVRYHFDQLVYEIHTATFPLGRALELAQGFGAPSCDPDTDSGPGPNTPASPAPPFCEDPSQTELTIPSDAPLPRGDQLLTSRDDFENSGVRGATSSPPAPGDAPWDLKFTRRSGDQPFKYACLIHPFMRGRVFVK